MLHKTDAALTRATAIERTQEFRKNFAKIWQAVCGSLNVVGHLHENYSDSDGWPGGQHAGDGESRAGRGDAATRAEPLLPTPAAHILQSDPKSEVQELLRQISELDDNWDSLTPAQRQQRIAGLEQQVTTVQRDLQDLPPDQRPEVEGMLGLAIIRLADLLRKAQTPPTSPCIFPFCLPGLS